MLGGWMVSIPAGAKNADAAWKFMNYAFVDEAAKMGYDTLNGPCVVKTYPDFIKGMTKILGENNRMSKYLEVFTKTGELGQKTWPVMRANAFYRDEETRIYDFITRGEKTPEEGLKEVTTNVQAEYDKGA
jgi:ABC-type glycerol-3-phosphate transport system substrate-binding protein